MPIIVFVLTLLLPLALSAAGFKNPDYANKRYKSIIVSVPIADLAMRDRMEKQISREIADHGGRAQPYLSAFSPAKQYTQAEIKDKLTTLDIDGILVVSFESEDRSRTGGAMALSQPMGYYNMTTVAPVTAHRRHAAATATLYDAASGESAFVTSAEASAKGLHARSDKKVLGRLAENIAKELKRGGVLAK